MNFEQIRLLNLFNFCSTYTQKTLKVKENNELSCTDMFPDSLKIKNFFTSPKL